MNSTQPRPSWPAPERQAPVYTDPQAMLAAMKAHARSDLNIQESLIDFLIANPGSSTADIAAAIGVTTNTASQYALAAWDGGHLRRRKFNRPTGGVEYRYEVAT